MRSRCTTLASALVLASLPPALQAQAQPPATLADLQPLAPVLLSRADLLALLPGAHMSRVNDKSNSHRWTNEPGGEMVVSSDNRSDGKPSTANGRWHIDEQGRYCLQVRWKRGPEEESCRYLLRAGEGFFAVEALEPPTRKLYPLSIGR